MIQITPVFVTMIITLFGLIGTIVGVYVQLTNKATELSTKVKALEDSKTNIWSKLDAHDDEIKNALRDINQSISRLELKIAEFKKN